MAFVEALAFKISRALLITFEEIVVMINFLTTRRIEVKHSGFGVHD